MLFRFLHIFLFFFPLLIQAQLIPIDNISKKEDLPQANVYSILQDKQGYMWFGTEAGLGRYDGKKFQLFDTDLGLSNNYIAALHLDKQGNIWMGTFGGGVTFYDFKEFKAYSVNDSLSGTEVNGVAEDKNGHIWFATTQGICKYDGKKFIKYNEKQGLTGKGFVCVHVAKNGTVWIGSKSDGAFKLQGNKFVKYDTTSGLANMKVYCIFEDNKGLIHIGTQEGLSVFNGKTFVNKYVADGLPANTIRAIIQDKKGQIWYGTSAGIGIQQPNGKFKYLRSINGLTVDYVISLYEDRQGIVWIGTYTGGVYKYISNKFQIYNSTMGLPNNTVRAIAQDTTGRYWFGTERGIAALQGDSIKTFGAEDGLAGGETVMSIYEDLKKNIWFATFGTGAIKYNGKTFKSYSMEQGIFMYVWSIYQDKDSIMWIGTYSQGVFKMKGDSILAQHNTTSDSLFANNITCILQDRKGNMWFGTYGEGVRKYDGKNFTKLTTAQGLSNDNVYGVMEDDQGRIWFNTEYGISIFDGKRFSKINKKKGLHSNSIWLMHKDVDGSIWVGHEKGIEKYNPTTGTSRFYGYQEGFTPIEVTAGAVYRDSDGNFWFGTIAGVVKYSPKEDLPNPYEPITLISNITLFNRDVPDWSEYADSFDFRKNLPVGLMLPYNQNFITFNFIGIHTGAPSKVRYQYMLKGFDNDWQPLTDRTEATYSNLPPGKYTFYLKARSGDGVWTKTPVEYSFVIDKPFWEKWWFYGSEVLLLILLFTASIYLNQRGANEQLATSLIFISLLIITEFFTMNLENFLQDYTGGVPIVKLLLNVILAISFSPMEKLAGKWIRMRKYKERLEKSLDKLNIDMDDFKIEEGTTKS